MAVLSSDYLSYSLRSVPGTADPITTLGITDNKFDFRLGHDVDELRERSRTDARWRRLSMLVLLSSAFEKYLVGAASAALDSDPTRSPGFPKRIDGLLLKKYSITFEQPSLQGLVHGEWSSRLALYRRLFGDLPPVLEAAESDLDSLRRIRNRVAHHFGINEHSLSPQGELALGGRRRQVLLPFEASVSHERLVQWMKLLGDVSVAIDRHLTTDFIGGYETAAIYVEWKRNPEKFERSVGITLTGHNKSWERRFGKMLSELIDKPLGYKYPQTLAAYVDRL